MTDEFDPCPHDNLEIVSIFDISRERGPIEKRSYQIKYGAQRLINDDYVIRCVACKSILLSGNIDVWKIGNISHYDIPVCPHTHIASPLSEIGNYLCLNCGARWTVTPGQLLHIQVREDKN